MMLTKALLDSILRFCAANGMTERQFGLKVANNHKLITRLKAGFGVNSQTHDRIMAFIEASERDARSKRRKRVTPPAPESTPAPPTRDEAA